MTLDTIFRTAARVASAYNEQQPAGTSTYAAVSIWYGDVVDDGYVTVAVRNREVQAESYAILTYKKALTLDSLETYFEQVINGLVLRVNSELPAEVE